MQWKSLLNKKIGRQLLLPQPVKNVFFGRLAEVKGVAKTSKPHSSAYIGTVEGGLRSKSKLPCAAGFFRIKERIATPVCGLARNDGYMCNPFINYNCILTVGGFLDALRQ